MIRNITRSTLVAAVAAIAAPAAAQDILQFRADALSEPQAGISIVSLDPVSVGTVVKNAPYTAEAVTEVTQTLSDGNRIERRTSATIARSSSGATRREQQGFALGGFVGQSASPIVTITDPKSGTHVTLNYDLKVAFRMKPGWAATRMEGGAVAFEPALASRGPGGAVAGRPGGRIIRREGPSDYPPLPAPPFEEPVIGMPPLAVASVGAVPAGPPDYEHKTETLEPRTIDGLRAEGTRSTMTIPAGAVGNEMPIEVINERWFSPELRIVLMTRRVDPRFGETIYRLTNVVRAEPAEELFKVPSDFRVQELKP
jgi:hypothetical protein